MDDDKKLQWWQRALGWGCVVALPVALWLTFAGPSVTYENLGPDLDREATVSCDRGYGNDPELLPRYEVTSGDEYLKSELDGYSREDWLAINGACERAISDRLQLSTWLLVGGAASGISAAIVGVHRRITTQVGPKPVRVGILLGTDLPPAGLEPNDIDRA